MTGYELLRHVRSDEKPSGDAVHHGHGPNRRRKKRHRGRKRPALNNYIVKPFNAQTLKSKIEAVCGRVILALPRRRGSTLPRRAQRRVVMPQGAAEASLIGCERIPQKERAERGRTWPAAAIRKTQAPARARAKKQDADSGRVARSISS